MIEYTQSHNGKSVDLPDELPRLKRSQSLWSCDFETAIAAAGFGKFNVYLVIIAGFTGLTTVFEGRSMAYIVPAAQCDLHLDIDQKAMLDSVPLGGMVLTSFMWGFLGDKLGRRKLILIICFLDFCCWIMAVFSQTFQVLLMARFFGGMVSSGIYPSLASYLTEVHGVKHKAVMQLFLGNIFGLGDMLLPILGTTVLTSEISYQFSTMVIHPWNIYLLICALLPFISGIGFLLLPESPKFLMCRNRNDEAINVFKSIYVINTSKSSAANFPVKSLKTVKSTQTKKIKRSPFINFFSPLFPFLEGKNRKNIILSLLTQFLIMMGLNAILLWLPQIFQEMGNHQRNNNGSATVCETLEDLEVKSNTASDVCDEDMAHNTSTYLYCMIVATATILVFAVSGLLINFIGKKNLLYFLGVFSSISTLLLIYAHDVITLIFLASVICAFGNIAFNALVAIVIDLFPTNLRAMSVSLTMMIGKLGGGIGCFIFPIFLHFGCSIPLVFLSYFMLVWVFLVFMLPDTDQTLID